MTQIIVLNGGSSSGKSSIARALQGVLPEPWLSWSIDDLVDAMPPALSAEGDGSGPGIEFGPGGEVAVGEDFSRAQTAWLAGIAAMARAGARVVLDDVFLGGGASQERMRRGLDGIDVLWVGVRCAPEIAAERSPGRSRCRRPR
jgi:chloramphenicol 3-O phosphotransferase